MALYTTMRVYQVPADNRIEATDRMLEALSLGVEKDFHVKDILRELGSGVRVSLKPTKGWGTPLRDQLLRRSGKTGLERLFLFPTETWGKVQKFNSYEST